MNEKQTASHIFLHKFIFFGNNLAMKVRKIREFNQNLDEKESRRQNNEERKNGH